MTRETLIFRELGRPPKPGEWYKTWFAESLNKRTLDTSDDVLYLKCRGYSCEVVEEPAECGPSDQAI